MSESAYPLVFNDGKQNFSVVLNQHSPMSDSAAHFLVTLKRPEQRQLDQQRKANCQQQPHAMGTQGQQAAHQAANAAHQAAHQASHQGLPRRQGLTGAAYPWAGMPHPPVTPQMQQAWNAAQEPGHTMQGTAGKRPANMWGAVPQHHQAVPPAQAQAQHYALAQAAAQAQALRHAEAPPPPPNPQMGPFNHPGHVQAAHAQASAAFQAAQHAQQAQHGQGFVKPPPPPPTNPGFGNAPRGPFPPPGHTDNWGRGSIPAVHMHQGSARPQGIRPQQPCPSPRVQPAELPFRPTRILTHANPGRLGQGAGRGGQNEAQEPCMADELPCSPSGAPPGFAHSCAAAPLPRLKTTGRAILEDDFWYGSPTDSILHPKCISKQNPFGAVSSPRTGTPTGGQGGPFTDPAKGVGCTVSSDREALQHVHRNGLTGDAEMITPVSRASLCHDQGLR